jgi:hypothetical protein
VQAGDVEPGNFQRPVDPKSSRVKVPGEYGKPTQCFHLCQTIERLVDFPLLCGDARIYEKQVSSPQVNADAQTDFIADPPTDKAGGDRFLTS